MRSALLLAALFLAATVRAEGWDASAPYKSKCSDGPQLQMNLCLGIELNALDATLSEAYLKLLANLRDPSRLRKAQSNWIEFREATCDFETSGLERGGSSYAYAMHACRIDLTVKRLRDLEEYSGWECNGCPPRGEKHDL